MNYENCLNYFRLNSINSFKINSEFELKKNIKSTSEYLYFILWSSEDNIYSWGTMSGRSNRIRKSSILNKKLTGKYDRRVDYLMLLKIYGFESIYLFEMNNTRYHEKHICNELKQKHCFYGITGNNRDEISKTLYSKFKLTEWYSEFNEDDQTLFNEFFYEIFLGKMKHPENPNRTFYYGDCLEPKFLRKINKEYLEPVIEKILDVNFYK